MKTSYFTFGQAHRHVVGETVFDKDCVAKVTAEDPREVMVKYFGPKWAFEYDTPPSQDPLDEFWPRGIIELDQTIEPTPQRARVYLGDSVYASYEDSGIRLCLDNGQGEHSHIFLDHSVYDALITFVENLRKN